MGGSGGAPLSDDTGRTAIQLLAAAASGGTVVVVRVKAWPAATAWGRSTVAARALVLTETEGGVRGWAGGEGPGRGKRPEKPPPTASPPSPQKSRRAAEPPFSGTSAGGRTVTPRARPSRQPWATGLLPRTLSGVS